jgi:hypothetical protein
MKQLLIIILVLSTSLVFGQTAKEKEENSNFIFESNLPDKLQELFRQDSIKSFYKINKEINPFYLRGDFDADGKIDYALAIIEIKSGKKGILIYHTGTKEIFFAGAGKKIPNSYGDSFHWMDAWKVYDKKDVGIGVGETKKLVLKGEAILAMKLESSSGIIYWDGKQYRWYQQGD